MTVNTNKKAVEPKGVPAVENKNEVVETTTALVHLPNQDNSAKAEKRLEKLEDFLQLRDVHDKLCDKQRILQEMTRAEDATTSCKIRIMGSGNSSLEITNSAVVKEVLEVATKTLNEAVAMAQHNVVNFEI
jgi:Fic family protein